MLVDRQDIGSDITYNLPLVDRIPNYHIKTTYIRGTSTSFALKIDE